MAAIQASGRPTARAVRVPRPHRRTQTRHHPKGLTCHHYAFFGMMCDEYDRMRERAAGCCEICGTPEAETGGKRLVVDHFQDTQTRLSFIRGLLCDRCNAVVMACMDGMKPWGTDRVHEAQAREYEARSWCQPTPEQWALVEEVRQRRQARLPGQPRPAAPTPRAVAAPRTVQVPVDSPELMVASLRSAMTDEQFAELAAAVAEYKGTGSGWKY